MIFSVSLPWRGGWGGSITAILLWLCLTLQLLAVITTISAERIQPYDVLGIHRRATNQEIRKAYKSKVKQWHPDKNEQDPEAQAKFVEINAAYELLSDPDRRRGYDNHGITEDSPNFRQVWQNFFL